uniref:Uncharacterized protein n=1 Tax=Panagrolaimus sp. JU765 TaxID=591449 RepID=A0AC34RIL4_9BILA
MSEASAEDVVKYVFDQICTNPVDYDWTREVIVNDVNICYNRENCTHPSLQHNFIKNVNEIECAEQLFGFTYREMILRIREVNFLKTLEFFYKAQTENAYVSKILFETSYETCCETSEPANDKDFMIINGCLCILITKNVKDMWDDEYEEEIQNLMNGKEALFDDEVEFHLMVNYEIIPVKTAADVADKLLKIKQGYFKAIPITVAISTYSRQEIIPEFKCFSIKLSTLNFLAAMILFSYYEKTDFPLQSNASDFQKLIEKIYPVEIDVIENRKSNKEKIDQFMISLMRLRQWSLKQIKRNVDLEKFELEFTACLSKLNKIAKNDAIFHLNRQPASTSPGNVPSHHENDFSNFKTAPPSYEDIPIRHEDTTVKDHKDPFPPENSAAKYTAEDEYFIAKLCSVIEAFHEDYWRCNVKIVNQDPRHITDIINEVCEHSKFFLKQRPLHKLKIRVDDFMFSLKSLKTEIESAVFAEAAFGKYKKFLADCEVTLQALFNQNTLPAQKAWLKVDHQKGSTTIRLLDKAKMKNWEKKLVITSTHWIIPFERFYGETNYDHDRDQHENCDDVYLEYFTWTFDRKQEEELPEPYLILNGDRYTLAIVETGRHFICGHLFNVKLLKCVCINCKMLFEPEACCSCRIKTESLVQCLPCWKYALGDVFKEKDYKLEDMTIISDEPVYENTRIYQPSTHAIYERIAPYLEQPSSSNITTPAAAADRHHFQEGIRA